MSYVSSTQFIEGALQQNELLLTELRRLREAKATHGDKQKEQQKNLDDAWVLLTEAALPTLTPAVLDDVARRVGLPRITWRQVETRMQQRRQELQILIEDVEKNPDFLDRENVINELQIKRRDLEETTSTLKASIDTLEHDPHFSALLGVDYDTERYSVGWWQLAYYRHWKWRDLVLDTYGTQYKVSRFSELADIYTREQEAWRTFRTELDALDQRQNQLQTMIKNRFQAKEELNNFDAFFLQRLRSELRNHFLSVDADDVYPMFQGNADAEGAAKRVLGLQAKIKYLDGLTNHWIDENIGSLTEAIEKNKRDVIKLRRPKNYNRTFPLDVYEKRFRNRTPQWDKRWQRYNDSYQTVYVYNNYDAYNPVENFLWWDVMTDGRLDGDFIPEVSQYRQTYGNTYRHDDYHHHNNMNDVNDIDDSLHHDVS